MRSLLVVLALLAGCSSAKQRPPIEPIRVDVALTTGDRAVLLADQPHLELAPATGDAPAVCVDDALQFQEVEGFGAAFTDSAAFLLHPLAADTRAAAMSDLFTLQGEGIGLSFARVPLGASDLSHDLFSYDDLDPGAQDPALAHFSIAHDEEHLVPLLLEARRLAPGLRLVGSPWSPPGWMKDSGDMVTGGLAPGMDAPLARYLVKALQAFDDRGIPFDYLTVQNEPLYVPVKPTPGMYLSAAAQRDLLRDQLLPALAPSGLATRVLVYDHNYDHPEYPQTILADPTLRASPVVAGIAWHGYGGTPGALLELSEQFPEKGSYETELSGGTWVADQVRADFQDLIHTLRSGARAYVKWSLALDPQRGPYLGGCKTCSPLVTVDPDAGTVTRAVEYYTLGHFSRYVRPGAHRVQSTLARGVMTVAFLNPDGSRALVAYNELADPTPLRVRWGTRTFETTLPARAGATFRWRGSQDAQCGIDATAGVRAGDVAAVHGLRTEKSDEAEGGLDLGYADAGDWARFPNVDFGAGVSAVQARVASLGAGGRIELRLDAPGGPSIGTVSVPSTGGWQSWTTVTVPVTGASARHDLYAVYAAGPGNLAWLRFAR